MITPTVKEWDILLYVLWQKGEITYAGYIELSALVGSASLCGAYFPRN
jgi:hypothetical protein